MKNFLHSFAGRLLLGGIIVHGVLIPLLSLGTVLVVKDGFETQFIDNARNETRELAQHMAEALDAQRIERHLADLAATRRFLFAEVTLHSGERYVMPDGEKPPGVFVEDTAFDQHGDHVYHIAVPLNGPDARFTGTLRLGYDESKTRELIHRTYELGLFVAAGYISLSLIVAVLIIPTLTAPLRALRDAARDIAAGGSTEKLHVTTTVAEIAALATELEHMRRALVERGQALAARETRLHSIMDNVVDAVITTGAHGAIESFNRAAETIFGHTAAEAVGENLNLLLAPARFSGNGEGANGTQPLTALPLHETTGRRKDGHAFPMEMAVSEMRMEDATHYVVIMRDITARKGAETELKALQEDLERRVIKRTRELALLNRELEHQALHDALTELPNRLLLQDRLRQAILTAQRERHPLALLIMDLDRFKEINDTLGHHYGDLVLRETATRMRGALRESDTIARLGGDEFAVLLPTIEDAVDAINAARKVLAAMERPVPLEGQNFQVGMSIGIAVHPHHGADSSTLMRHADVAMYVAKRASSGFCVYDPEQDQHSVSRLALAGELRRAIEHKQLVLFYQPKIDLKLGRVTGVEALVRWDHPQRGLLLPDDFIPVAEHTGLIRPLTLFVLEEALQQIHHWQRAGLALTVAVNLSARHLQDQQLSARIQDMLDAWDVDPAWLELEITENAIMADPRRAMETLTQLDRMNIRLSIDDFGTGYSSLVYLKQLPVDEIKIDKSFVLDMAHNNDDLVIVRSTIDLAHNMGRRVVAEGVETKEVLEMLVDLGCDMAQGHHMSRPLTPAVLFRWLTDSPWRIERRKDTIQRD